MASTAGARSKKTGKAGGSGQARPAAAASSTATPGPAQHTTLAAGSSFSFAHLALLLLFNAALMSLSVWAHYHLPTPRPIDVATTSSPAHFSELAALEHIRVLSDQIGYRIVGTRQHVEAEKWLESVVAQYQGWHHTVDRPDNVTGDPRGDTQVEVWTQIGDGAHR